VGNCVGIIKGCSEGVYEGAGVGVGAAVLGLLNATSSGSSTDEAPSIVLGKRQVPVLASKVELKH